MSLDLTSFDAGLKQHYTSDRVRNMVYMDNAFLAIVPKMEKFGGRNLPIPIIYGNPTGRSAAFATAQANKNNSRLEDFVLTRNHDYSLASIDNETLEASIGDVNAFMEAAATEIDGAINAAARSLATAIYRDGNGTIGRVNNTVFTGTAIDLVTDEDVVNFEVGMKLQFSSAGTVATIRDSGDTLTITAVNRTAATNQVTVSTILSNIAGIAQNDFINVQGDLEAKIKGLEAWLPFGGASATAFFGVDRSVDTRLGGLSIDGSALPIEEALINGASKCAREGGRPNYCMLNFEQFANLEKSLGAKVTYLDVMVGNIGFRALVINGPKGPIKVVPDQNCPMTNAYMLTLETWKLYSLGPAPKILDSDGLKFLREGTADAVEVRCGYYAQLGCQAPGWNINIKLQ